MRPEQLEQIKEIMWQQGEQLKVLRKIFESRDENNDYYWTEVEEWLEVEDAIAILYSCTCSLQNAIDLAEGM